MWARAGLACAVCLLGCASAQPRVDEHRLARLDAAELEDVARAQRDRMQAEASVQVAQLSLEEAQRFHDRGNREADERSLADRLLASRVTALLQMRARLALAEAELRLAEFHALAHAGAAGRLREGPFLAARDRALTQLERAQHVHALR
jgi:hypothetical protein